MDLEPEQVADRAPARLPTGASLRVHNFRVFFLGQLVSLTGTWTQTVARAWLVLEVLDGGATAVGVVTALEALPMLLFGAHAGVLADRVDKRAGLLVTQATMAAFAACLAVLTALGWTQLWMVAVLAFAQGTASAFDLTLRQSIVSEMVPPRLVANAVALNAAVFNAARVFGPALGGVVIVAVGTAACFGINALSYLAALAALLAVRPAELHRAAAIGRARGQIGQALRYVRHDRSLARTLLLTLLVMPLANSATVIIPVLAVDGYDGSARTLSILSTTVGIGAVAGALIAARRHQFAERSLRAAALALGAVTILAGIGRGLVVVAVLLAMAGGCSTMFASMSMTRTQLLADPAMRGRVLAFRLLLVVGSTPFIGPAVGVICEALGPRQALSLTGGVIATGAAAFTLTAARADLRRAAGTVGPLSTSTNCVAAED